MWNWMDVTYQRHLPYFYSLLPKDLVIMTIDFTLRQHLPINIISCLTKLWFLLFMLHRPEWNVCGRLSPTKNVITSKSAKTMWHICQFSASSSPSFAFPIKQSSSKVTIRSFYSQTNHRKKLQFTVKSIYFYSCCGRKD